MNEKERASIIKVLCSLSLSDHLGDVRDAEEGLWNLLDVGELPFDNPAWDNDSAFVITRARLRSAGLSLPAYLQDADEDE